jgi:hypothetical protein
VFLQRSNTWHNHHGNAESDCGWRTVVVHDAARRSRADHGQITGRSRADQNSSASSPPLLTVSSPAATNAS